MRLKVWGEMLTVVAASAAADIVMPDVRDTMKRKKNQFKEEVNDLFDRRGQSSAFANGG